MKDEVCRGYQCPAEVVLCTKGSSSESLVHKTLLGEKKKIRNAVGNAGAFQEIRMSALVHGCKVCSESQLHFFTFKIPERLKWRQCCKKKKMELINMSLGRNYRRDPLSLCACKRTSRDGIFHSSVYSYYTTHERNWHSSVVAQCPNLSVSLSELSLVNIYVLLLGVIILNFHFFISPRLIYFSASDSESLQIVIRAF